MLRKFTIWVGWGWSSLLRYIFRPCFLAPLSGHVLAKKNWIEKYAVETKRANNLSFDVVGSQQKILKAFDRKEAVKCVKRNLIPCVHSVGLHFLYCLLREGCVCVCVRVFREAGYEGEAGNVQRRQRRVICSICLQCDVRRICTKCGSVLLALSMSVYANW